MAGWGALINYQGNKSGRSETTLGFYSDGDSQQGQPLSPRKSFLMVLPSEVRGPPLLSVTTSTHTFCQTFKAQSLRSLGNKGRGWLEAGTLWVPTLLQALPARLEKQPTLPSGGATQRRLTCQGPAKRAKGLIHGRGRA